MIDGTARSGCDVPRVQMDHILGRPDGGIAIQDEQHQIVRCWHLDRPGPLSVRHLHAHLFDVGDSLELEGHVTAPQLRD